MGFPTRYVDHGWSEAVEELPELSERRLRASASERHGSALTDAMFMSSRDGHTFNLWPESFIRPGLRPVDNWVYGDGYPGWGIVTTPSLFDGAPEELSIYVSEGYWRGRKHESAALYAAGRWIRVGTGATQAGAQLVTKPLTFAGNRLRVNFSASAAGIIQVEILRDQMDESVAGFGLDDCVELLGDDIERVVRWSGGADISRLEGVPVRLRFVLRDADLYALQFVKM